MILSTVEGFVVKRTNLGEADRLVTVYTRNHGKIRLLAKGIRRITSRRSGNLELFNLTKIHFRSGRNSNVISEAETLQSFPRLRRQLVKVALAYQAVEIIDRLIPEQTANSEIFTLLLTFFNQLNQAAPLRPHQSMAQFAVQILRALGYWPSDLPFVGDWKSQIESIIERPLRSPGIFKQNKW